jgi:hypothetical protein
MGVEILLARFPDEFEKENIEGTGMVKGRKAVETEAKNV